jgi:hypothetical protein
MASEQQLKAVVWAVNQILRDVDPPDDDDPEDICPFCMTYPCECVDQGE